MVAHIHPTLFKFTLLTIAAIQVALGVAFLLAPAHAAVLLGLTPAAPAWADWLFGMMGARFIGYAYGMLLAARSPDSARAWISSMAFIQLADWLVTLKFVMLGAVTLTQVSTASFLPVIFVIVLVFCRPRATTIA